MTLLEHQARIAFIDPKRLNRAIESTARRYLPNTQRRRPRTTVNDNIERLQQLLPRCIQDEQGATLDWDTIAKARSQSLWDQFPHLRSGLSDRIAWSSFTPKPTWRW